MSDELDILMDAAEREVFGHEGADERDRLRSRIERIRAAEGPATRAVNDLVNPDRDNLAQLHGKRMLALLKTGTLTEDLLDASREERRIAAEARIAQRVADLRKAKK